MKRALVLVLALLIPFGLVACGDDGPDHGRVLDKEYDEPWLQTIQNCVSFGKYGCTDYVATFIQHDAVWKLKLRLGGDEGWHDVSEAAYDG